MESYSQILHTLESEDNLRRLRDATPDGRHVIIDGVRYLNMSSNDYLGLGADLSLQQEFMAGLGTPERYLMSNPSSRLMTGNSVEYRRLESAIAGLYPGRECLVYGSGYLANSTIPAALALPGDVVLADRLVHASLIDGLRLGGSTWERFRHNDTEHLEKLIIKHRGRGARRVWVVTESVFSMDGDLAPLEQIVALKQKYDLMLYLDEAHAIGVYGTQGEGLAGHLGLAPQFDVIVGTLGKAVSSHGGFAVTDGKIRSVLVNRSRGVIFSTALPPLSLMWSEFVVSRLGRMSPQREKLAALARILARDGREPSHIVPVMTWGNEQAQRWAETFRREGYWVTPVRYPTVPRGESRLRISLSAAMDTREIEKLSLLCNSIG